MEMTLMRRDLAGSFRFGGTLASIALALPRLPVPVSLCTQPASQPVPQASLPNGGAAALVTALAPRLAIPTAAWPRTVAGGWEAASRGGRAESRDDSAP